MHGARRVPGQPQEGRALVRVALDDLCDVGRHRLVVDSVRGACRGGRDGSDDGGDGASQDGASLQRCRGFMGLRGTRRAAEAREACLAPAAGCQASVQPSLQGLQVRRVERRDSACKEQLIEHRFAGFGQFWQLLRQNEVPLPRCQRQPPISHQNPTRPWGRVQCRVRGDWLMCGTYPNALLLSRARRGGDDAHARGGAERVPRHSKPPLPLCRDYGPVFCAEIRGDLAYRHTSSRQLQRRLAHAGAKLA